MKINVFMKGSHAGAIEQNEEGKGREGDMEMEMRRGRSRQRAIGRKAERKTGREKEKLKRGWGCKKEGTKARVVKKN